MGAGGGPSSMKRSGTMDPGVLSMVIHHSLLPTQDEGMAHLG